VIQAPDTAYSGFGGWYFFENSCGVDSDTFSLLVHPLPVVNLGEDTTLCNASVLSLSAGSFDDYLWSTGATTSSILLNAGEEPLTEDQTVWVQVTNENGCVASDTIQIEVIEQPTFYLGDNIEACLSEVITLSVPNVYDNFIWSDSTTGTSITAHDGSIIMPGQYQFWVEGSNDGGCSYSDTIYVLLIDCDGEYVGIDELSDRELSLELYPNPASVDLNLVLNASAEDLRSVKIFGNLGELARTYGKADWSSNGHDGEVVIQLGDLPNGVYLLQVDHASGIVSKRLIIGR
jgi:hypothetical protein